MWPAVPTMMFFMLAFILMVLPAGSRRRRSVPSLTPAAGFQVRPPSANGAREATTGQPPRGRRRSHAPDAGWAGTTPNHRTGALAVSRSDHALPAGVGQTAPTHANTRGRAGASSAAHPRRRRAPDRGTPAAAAGLFAIPCREQYIDNTIPSPEATCPRG